MTDSQVTIMAILGVTLVLFIWDRWRHDMVAIGALLACVVAGLVPADQAFAGFGHPAVITVAAVLVLSSGLQASGAVDAVARMVLPAQGAGWWSVAALAALSALLSAFMNNVGALALLMPLAVQIAAREGLPVGRVLMPLAFGSILGGMTTLIGTPPNLIVSGYRAAATGEGFAMFDFAPVGVVAAIGGLAFLAVFARWLVPERHGAAEGFETGAYLTEAKIGADSKAIGLELQEVERRLEAVEAQVIGLVRDDRRIPAPSPWRTVQEGDILVIEAEPRALAGALTSLGLKLEEDVDPKAEAKEVEEEAPDSLADRAARAIRSDEVALIELAVRPSAEVVGRSASGLRLRTRYGVNLLAVSRRGRRSLSRLRSMPIAAGDLLLMQGPPEAVAEFAAQAGCVPLAERPLSIPDRRRMVKATLVMGAAVAVAALGILPTAVAFVAGVLAALVTGTVPLRRAYAAVDWPVVVLLAALMPVAGAMATTGAAELLAQALLRALPSGDPMLALTLVLAVTMALSSFLNNAATAAVMCPIAARTAAELGVGTDAFLMGVAIAASCAFATPIGHQNNTLILGPGGFRFGDYWRLGVPLGIIVIVLAVPLLLLIWGG